MFDVSVIGAGFGGLIAAVRAQQLGLRVALLERSPTVPGESNARLSGGVFHIAFKDPVLRSPDELLAAIMAATDGLAAIGVAETIAHNAGRVVSWLEELGVGFVSDGPPEYRNKVLAPFFPAGPGLRWEGRGPQACLEVLARRFLSDGGAVLTDARAVEVHRIGEHFAVNLLRRDEPETLTARAVVLADGGFHSDPTALRELAGVNPDNIVVRGSATSQGDGIGIGKALGGFLVNTSGLYGHLLAREARENPQLMPYPWADALAQHGVVVGASGHRIGWPGLSGTGYVNLVARAASDLHPWAVCDARAWEGPAAAGALPANPLLPELGGTLLEEPTLDALAASMGVRARALASAVSQHNALVRAAGEARFPGAKHTAAQVTEPPFYAVPVVAGITNTLGGLAVDGAARVLTVDGTTVDHLYAIGGCAGGLQGSPSGGYVGGLAEAGVLGLLCAEDAHRQVRASNVEEEDAHVES